VTEAEAEGAPEPAARAVLEARLTAAQDLLERVRRAALAGGEITDLDRLSALLQALADQLGRISNSDRLPRDRLLALLDDLGGLTEMLRAQQARLGVQLRAAGDHRRVGTAYRRASRL
jgi:hypothetical protein